MDPFRTVPYMSFTGASVLRGPPHHIAWHRIEGRAEREGWVEHQVPHRPEVSLDQVWKVLRGHRVNTLLQPLPCSEAPGIELDLIPVGVRCQQPAPPSDTSVFAAPWPGLRTLLRGFSALP